MIGLGSGAGGARSVGRGFVCTEMYIAKKPRVCVEMAEVERMRPRTPRSLPSKAGMTVRANRKSRGGGPHPPTCPDRGALSRVCDRMMCEFKTGWRKEMNHNKATAIAAVVMLAVLAAGGGVPDVCRCYGSQLW